MSDQVARTILQQLGGNRFAAMTGASSFSSGKNMLTFRLPARSTKNNGSAMRITLTPLDVYKLELLKVVNFEVITISMCDDVYAENLQDTFTEMTGLYTTLGRAA